MILETIHFAYPKISSLQGEKSPELCVPQKNGFITSNLTVMQNETVEIYCKLANTLKMYEYFCVDLFCKNLFCLYVIRSFNYTDNAEKQGRTV